MSNAKLAKSGKHPDLKFGTYNCNGLTNERLSWLIGSQDDTQQGLGFDFLGLTECHGGEWLADVWGRQRLLVSGPRDETKNEKAAGVHIACSERGARAVRSRVAACLRVQVFKLESLSKRELACIKSSE